MSIYYIKILHFSFNIKLINLIKHNYQKISKFNTLSCYLLYYHLKIMNIILKANKSI